MVLALEIAKRFLDSAGRALGQRGLCTHMEPQQQLAEARSPWQIRISRMDAVPSYWVDTLSDSLPTYASDSFWNRLYHFCPAECLDLGANSHFPPTPHVAVRGLVLYDFSSLACPLLPPLLVVRHVCRVDRPQGGCSGQPRKVERRREIPCLALA